MIRLNYFNCIKDKYLKSGLSTADIVTKDESNLKDFILNKKMPMMDWLELPYQDKDYIREIQDYGKLISKSFDNFVVIGIGGSALGAIAVKKALYNNCCCKDKKEKKIKVKIVDNIDPEKFDRLTKKLDIKKTMFNIVTKSGKTVEILSEFAYILKLLKDELKDDYNKNLVITTEKDNLLWNFGAKNKIKTFEVPKQVGGRYSVLSPVGLLPMAVMKINLNNILDGAKKVLEDFKTQSADKNICMLSAIISYKLLLKGKREFVILPYSDRLEKMADFYIQLLSESLGKSHLISGKKNKLFFTPTKAVGVTYQHSLLQMYQEGSQDRIFCFLNLEKPAIDIKLPKTKDKEIDALLPTSLDVLFKSEKTASSLALKMANNPSYELIMPSITEENVGSMIFYFELTTALLGKLMGVNAYDQNGVELQKKFTKAMIGVKGFETQHAQLDSMLANKSEYEI